MTKLESIEHKIFASEAPLDEIGQFGSALDTTKLNTKDVNTIQALPAYAKGWGSAVVSDSNYPTMEEMNGVLNVMSYHTGYLYQEGMPAWRSDREYSATSIVKEPTSTKFFRSLKDGNIGNTLDNTEYWEELKFGGSGLELCDTDIVIRDDEKMFTQLQQMKRSTFDLSKLTVVGTPTITEDGVASGFSANSYLRINTGDWSWSTFVISCKFTTNSNLSGTQLIYGDGYSGLYLYNRSLSIKINYINQSGEYSILTNLATGLKVQPNTTYYTKLLFDGTGYKVLWSVDGVQFTQCYSDDKIDVATFRSFFIGKNVSMNNFKGGVYLNYFSIVANGVEFLNFNKTGIDTIKPDNYEVVGSPVISDDGILSNISVNNNKQCIKLDTTSFNANLSSKLVEIEYRAKLWKTTNSSTIDIGAPFGTTGLNIGNGNANGTFVVQVVNDTDQAIILDSSNFSNYLGKWYNAKFVSDGTNYSINITFDDGYTVSSNIATTTSFALPSELFIGTVNTGGECAIDLNAFKIYVDGNLVYQPCLKIPYTQSKTGSKIVDGVYRDRVIDLYEQEGQAGYYTIDEPNKNFTLPMGEIYGMIEQKGTYHPPLLSTMWSDHLLNDMSWLRADTFSWQDGNTYSLAYNELLSEYNNSASVSTTEGSITFKRTPKGYKIALSTQETAIAEKYATDGIAWYYILDTTNKRFKLPRTKFGFEGLRTSVGDDIEAGLPNITGYLDIFTSQGTQQNGALSKNVASQRNPASGGELGWGNIQLNASNSNSIYGKSDTVQPPSTQMYLYFYVGNFTKSAEAQTAGLNSELFNGKVDKSDLAEIYPVVKTYVNGTSWYRIWSDGWCEQGGRLYNAKDVANTITLLKTMKDTNYSVFIAHGVTGVHNDTAAMKRAEEPFNFTATSFQVYTHPSAGLNTVQWKVCGYLAEGWNNEGIS